MDDVQLPAGNGGDGGQHIRGGVPGAAGHPGFADDVVRFQRHLGSEPVPGRQRHVKRLMRQRYHRHSLLRPARAVVHAVRQHQVVPRRQRGEVLLGHVLVKQLHLRLAGSVQ